MRASHCNDERLISYMDGELPCTEEDKVRSHLQDCWKCRTRLSQLEEQIRVLSEAYVEQVFPGPHRIAQAEQRVLARYEQWEREAVVLSQPAQTKGMHLRVSMRACAVGGIAASLMALAVWLLPDSRRVQELPAPREVAERAARMERVLYKAQLPVHQVFRVTVEEIAPRPNRRVSQLELWSEASTGRYASRWNDESGVLKLACWRPDLQREFAYEPSASTSITPVRPHPIRVRPLAELAHIGRSTIAMEAWLWQWLKGRQWEPVLLTAAIEEFRDGEMDLKLERNRSADGTSSLLMTIERTIDGIRARLVIEVDPKSYQPRMQMVRFETDDRIMEWRMELERADLIRPASLPVGLFEPNPALMQPSRSVRRAVPQAAPAQLSASPSVALVVPSISDLDRAELRALHVLHRAGACMGEPVEIVRDSSEVVVRGFAESPRRKQELLAALAPLEILPFFRVDVSAADETQQTAPQQAPRDLNDEAAVDSQEQHEVVRLANDPLEAAKHLERFFSERAKSTSSAGMQMQINRFSAESLARSHELLAHAWAVWRIVKRYPDEKARRLDIRSLELLESMLQSHIEALEYGADRLNYMVREPLRLMAMQAGTGAEKRAKAQADWRSATMSLLLDMQRVDALVASLFAGAEAPLDRTDASGARLRTLTPEQQAAELLSLLPGVRVAAAEVVTESAIELSEVKLLARGRE